MTKEVHRMKEHYSTREGELESGASHQYLSLKK